MLMTIFIMLKPCVYVFGREDYAIMQGYYFVMLLSLVLGFLGTLNIKMYYFFRGNFLRNC